MILFQKKRAKLFFIAQLLVLCLLGVLAFQISVASASGYSYASLGTSYPITYFGGTYPGGRPYNLIPHMTLNEGTAGQPNQFRLFNMTQSNIRFYAPEISYMQNNAFGNDYKQVFHVQDQNSQCAPANVDIALDAHGYPLDPSSWGTNLPNAYVYGDDRTNHAYCGDKSHYNEIRFRVYDYSHRATIDPNTDYIVSTSFVDYNWPNSRHWIQGTYNFYKIATIGGEQKADYGNNQLGYKLCVDGYNNAYTPHNGTTC